MINDITIKAFWDEKIKPKHPFSFTAIIEKDLYPTIKVPKDTVFVTWNFQSNQDPKNVIGEVKIKQDDINKCYIGDFELYSSLKTLHILKILEANKKLYPAVGGSVTARNGRTNEIISFRLNEVSICPNNLDPSVPPIKITIKDKDYKALQNQKFLI